MEDVDVELQDGIDLEDDATLKALAKSASAGQPKSQKIRDFKARVLSLLELYSARTKQHGSLFKALRGVFPQVSQDDAVKLDRVLGLSLERGGGATADLEDVTAQYVTLLCRTRQSHSAQQLTRTLCRLLQHRSAEEATQLAEDLLVKFITKRSVRVHLDSFKVLARRFKFLREPLLAVLDTHESSDAVRPSMRKQLAKLRKMLGAPRAPAVKREE